MGQFIIESRSQAAPSTEAAVENRCDRLYDRLEAALRLIAERRLDQPGLEEMARSAGMSTYHFQRVFTRWVGISPKKFLQYLTLQYAKDRLAEADSVLGAALDAGLSGPGRLHDLFVTHEAMTPGEFKRRGEGIEVQWGWHPSPFGDCLLMQTERGLCGLAFTGGPGGSRGGGGREATFREMTSRWPLARLIEEPRATAETMQRVFDPSLRGGSPLPLHLCGTNFQIRVWEALLSLPEGVLVSYGRIAEAIGQPHAARAVGAAIGANPISWLIPCHRAILSNGYLRSYAWGTTRKAAMIGWEAARRETGAPEIRNREAYLSEAS